MDKKKTSKSGSNKYVVSNKTPITAIAGEEAPILNGRIDVTPPSTSTNNEYDLMHIAQYHDVISNFSRNCFETKKVAITTFIAYYTIIITYMGYGDLMGKWTCQNTMMFLVAVLIPIIFYFYDVYNFYYTKKFRDKMSDFMVTYRERNGITREVAYDQPCTLLDKWTHCLDTNTKGEVKSVLSRFGETMEKYKKSKLSTDRMKYYRVYAFLDESTLTPYLIFTAIALIIFILYCVTSI